MLDWTALFVYNCKSTGGDRRAGCAAAEPAGIPFVHRGEGASPGGGKRRGITIFNEYRQKTLELCSVKWYSNHCTDILI